ncbi:MULTISPECIES: rhomboid family intramembrane serine protease [Aerococcus]|uniref:Rhomboid family intramembrane serine protease n=1 Tax=Aerococcus sanguinicola TaxID=119206 RepID=A0A5N1GQ01_9LACT|nr:MULTISPECIES: rhomboid family intramembrane serine protease [Aerococcus]KAA9302121.1 rhomboid family intramembrane serine protease [Aerococcus sanguinicola]MDK6368449.1 rhomboid family intramembrane serine protease [Aerococcus sp. UMB9870]MDK6679532.1 rhomboid family intramembrane serine protease [Aerococcus sp. UMB8608]MDK6686376.1 rhomboid family intramembrane serine protease [Aerococcus sp. UMB8623]MDK6941002.1 rhomboid family intramembrane serine protease [Aerococcus sp. UMB8487]
MKQKLPFVSYSLLAIQIIIWLVMTGLGGSQRADLLILFGAKVNALIAAGQYWRLLTPIFIHIGLTHLLFNSITLYYLGPMVENIVGHWRFLAIYLLSGLMGNLMSYQFSDAISAGASTALFGLFAFFIVKAYLHPNNPYYEALGRTYKTLIIMNIVLNLLASNVDLAGHLGGALGGLLASFIFAQNRNEIKVWQVVLALGLYLVIAYVIMANQGIYQLLF